MVSLVTVRKCAEDNSICVPMNKHCDRMADCPLGSDESDCSCTDLDMQYCKINEARLCIFKDWEMDKISIPICQNSMKQYRQNQLVQWKYLGELSL